MRISHMQTALLALFGPVSHIILSLRNMSVYDTRERPGLSLPAASLPQLFPPTAHQSGEGTFSSRLTLEPDQSKWAHPRVWQKETQLVGQFMRWDQSPLSAAAGMLQGAWQQ